MRRGNRGRARPTSLAAAGVVLLCGCGTMNGSQERGADPLTVTSSSAPTSAPTGATEPGSIAPSATSATSAPSSSTEASLASTFEEVRSGVVRLEVADCDGGGQGTGFALTSTLVATVAHVVEDGHVIRVIQGTTSTAGTVIGISSDREVALVQTTTPLSGYVFTFSDTPAQVGEQVAALGFPRGEPLGLNPGTVNGLDRKLDFGTVVVHGLIEMDAALNPGSSGGPVIRADGAVVGLVEALGNDPNTGLPDQGRRFAVSAQTAKQLIDDWQTRPSPPAPTDCATTVDADGQPLPPELFPTQAEMQAVATLNVYFRGIAMGDYPTALAQLIHPGPLDEFAADVASTRDRDFTYESVRRAGDRLVLWVTFTSDQEPGKGPAARPQETCTQWSLDYEFARHNGLWLIDGSSPHDGAGDIPCPATDSTAAIPSAGRSAPTSSESAPPSSESAPPS